MKLKISKYHNGFRIGISYNYFNDIYKTIVLDLIFFYIELVIKDYPKNGNRFYK